MYCVLTLFGRRGARAYAFVDVADYQALSKHRWYLSANGYAVRMTGSDHRRMQPMHRDLLGLSHGERIVGDHINRNRLDNRRSNLRRVTHAQNMQNKSPQRRNRTGLRGVRRYGNGVRQFQGAVTVAGVRHSTRMFATAPEADAALRELRSRLMPFSEDADW